MKIFEKFRKMILSLLIVILLFFSMPIRSEAGAAQWAGNTLGQPIMQFTAMLGDIGIGVLHKFVLNNKYGFMNSVMLDRDNQTVTGGDLSVQSEKDKENYIDLTDIEFDGTVIGTGKDSLLGTYVKVTDPIAGEKALEAIDNARDGTSIPNIMICPEYIFSNRIALLDVDFVNPTQYEYQNGKAITSGLQSVISSWYRAFRNIAIVAMLTILVYIGIRILIGSTAQDKAKYKERLQDWLVGLCLIFIMHYIMAGTLMVTKGITNMLSDVSPGYVVKLSGNFPEKGSTGNSDFYVKENMTGYVRLMAQQKELTECFAYVIMYIVLVIFTYMFLVKYIKRVLYMAFFTMIAPLVAMTYPLDKLADGKSQGFSMWFKEYLMNALIQPVHLILYTVFISTATSLAQNNIIYSMVALGFLIPAEKFIKSMFRLDQGKTTGFLGDIAGGALAVQGMKSLSNAGKGLAKSSSGGGSSKDKDNSKIRVNKSETDYLSGWKDDSQPNYAVGTLDTANNGEQAPRLHDGLGRHGLGDGDEEDTDYSNPIRYPDMPSPLSETGETNAEYWDRFDREHGINDYEEGLDEAEDLNNNIDTGNDWSQFDTDNMTDLNFIDGTTDHHFKDQYMTPPPSSKGDEDAIPEKDRWSALKGTAERGLRAVGNGIYDNRRRIIKGAAGTLARGAAGMVGASIGLAAGITTGDLSKVAALTTGGLYAGRAIGNKATNAGEALFDKGYEAAQTIHDAYREEKVGLKQAERERKAKENEKAKREFMRDSSEIARYKEVAAKTNQDYHNVMENAWNYREAGITDGDKIAKALEIENKHRVAGESAEAAQRRHHNMIGVMQATKNMSEDTILDERKRKALEKSLTSQLGGNSQKAQELLQLAAETVGQGEYYRDIKKEEANQARWAESAAREKAEQEKQRREKARVDKLNEDIAKQERAAEEKREKRETEKAKRKAEEAEKAKYRANGQGNATPFTLDGSSQTPTQTRARTTQKQEPKARTRRKIDLTGLNDNNNNGGNP